ncbi:hypothetical protein Dthio_PD3837 [Desulfonatronospira thiodismutans ASO3-1]|uniref:Uncharacterized protein n=1 Tax=Desulfonatronospira thiodismutans ASO3-1 TaxID=555779 RepID=D6SKG3_9BACT|nr:hypothetical protein Dthio_PD3837 [Desulfonatronospira thiodismutans ASO3-1]
MAVFVRFVLGPQQVLDLVEYLPRKIPAWLNFFTFNWVFSFYGGLLNIVLACLVKCRNKALLRRISLGRR